MNINKTLFSFIISIFFLSITLQAQKNITQKWEFGAWAGGASYYGDIRPDYLNVYKVIREAGGVYVRINIDKRLAIKTSLNYGRIQGNDAFSVSVYEQARNLSFRSDIFELATQFEFNFFPYIMGSENDRFTPYVLLGISGFHHNPKALINGAYIPLQSLGTEGQQFVQFYGRKPYKLYQIAIPFGGGFKLNASKHLTLGFELGYRFTFTDYLDDISTTYVDPNVLLSGNNGQLAASLGDRSISSTGEPIGVEGKQRGDNQLRDAFIFSGISLSYTLRSLRCPYPAKRR